MKKSLSALAGQVPSRSRHLPQASLLLVTLFQATSLVAHPEILDETTVLATGFSTGKNDTGLRVNVEDGETLNDAGIWRLHDAILLSPGVNVFSNGTHGSASSLFTRGTESDHTALFVDRVKLTDSRIFPFPTANILSGASVHPGERIELLRGSQSALYGSDAIGGALSLSLEKGSDHGNANRAWVELGSFDSIVTGVSLQGQGGKLSYNTFASRKQTANARSHNDHKSIHTGLRLDYAPADTTNVGLTLRLLSFDTELPPLGKTPFAINETENTIYSIFIEHQITDIWFTRLALGGYESQFTNTGGLGNSTVDTSYQSADWSNRLIWNQHHETSAGVSITWLDTSNSGAGIASFSEQNESVYLQHRWHTDDVFDLLVGLRHDQYEGGEDSTTFRLAGSYRLFQHAKAHSSLASGFRRPSAVDLFGFFGQGGNLKLESEQSLGWDTGITWEVTDTSWIDITYFHQEIEDLIASGPSPTFTAMNIQEARTRGMEVGCGASFFDERLHARLAYTWLQAENLTTSTRLVRRPEHTLNADISANVTDKLVLGTGLIWVANREDFDSNSFARIDAEDYATARIYTRYQLNDMVAINGRIENLFDQKYSEVDGFPARGIGAFTGVTIQW